MVPLLLALFLPIATTAYPNVDWDYVVARVVTRTLTQGMTEEEVYEIIGAPPHGFTSTYPQYHLKLGFGQRGLGFAFFVKHPTEAPAELHWYDDLPLPYPSPEHPLRHPYPFADFRW